MLDELTTFLDYEDQENVLQCVRRIVDSSQQQAQPDDSTYGSNSWMTDSNLTMEKILIKKAKQPINANTVKVATFVKAGLD